MSNLDNALELLTQQQGTDKNNQIYWVGEQLKDMCKESEINAELLAHDLKNEKMTVSFAEKEIDKYASTNKTGNKGCCPPHEADRILREFYGLQARDASAITGNKPKTVNLLDFM